MRGDLIALPLEGEGLGWGGGAMLNVTHEDSAPFGVSMAPLERPAFTPIPDPSPLQGEGSRKAR